MPTQTAPKGAKPVQGKKPESVTAPKTATETKPPVKPDTAKADEAASTEAAIIADMVQIIRLQADALWFRDKAKKLEIKELAPVIVVMDKLVEKLEQIEETLARPIGKPSQASTDKLRKAYDFRKMWEEKLKAA